MEEERTMIRIETFFHSLVADWPPNLHQQHKELGDKYNGNFFPLH